MTMHDSDAVLDQLMSKAGLLVADAVAPVSAPVDRRHDHIALAIESAHLPGDAARRFLRSVLEKVDAGPLSGRRPFPRNTALGEPYEKTSTRPFPGTSSTAGAAASKTSRAGVTDVWFVQRGIGGMRQDLIDPPACHHVAAEEKADRVCLWH